MARFTLSIISEDRQILTVERPVRQDEYEMIIGAVDHWRKNGGVLVIADCIARDTRQIELELDIPVSLAEVRHERLLNDR